MEASKKYRIVQELKDQSFDLFETLHYELNIVVAKNNLRYIVVNKNTKCIVLLDYALSAESLHDDNFVAILSSIYKQDDIVSNRNWKKIKIAFQDQHYINIPDAVFDHEALPEYLKTHQLPENVKFYYNSHKAKNIHNVFALPETLVTFFENQYLGAEIQVYNTSYCFLNALLENNCTEQLCIHIEDHSMQVGALEKDNLVLQNDFSYADAKEFLYFLGLIFENLGWDKDQNEIKLFGEISPDGSITNLLKKYFKNLSFVDHLSKVSYAEDFSKIMIHRYYILFSLLYI